MEAGGPYAKLAKGSCALSLSDYLFPLSWDSVFAHSWDATVFKGVKFKEIRLVGEVGRALLGDGETDCLLA